MLYDHFNPYLLRDDSNQPFVVPISGWDTTDLSKLAEAACAELMARSAVWGT